MEAHFVAKDRKGHILVVSVLIAEGKTDNPVSLTIGLWSSLSVL